MSAVSPLLPRLVLLPLLLLGCRDYAYRHELEGVVLDAKGAPLANAEVQRLNEKSEPYGFDSDYLRVTDEAGHFSFAAEGRGPSPLEAAPWRLRVKHAEAGEREVEVQARWQEQREGAVCWGYCAKGLSLQFDR